ncbi:MarR family winged helix-turn-helix transcriptional regulator [Pseudonocardia sp. GCM10023141]|uniref:MarR family winged helix-turn-helix transcriptional regulator n=1 Tax=Pseudonocardia sp. GCM10023141 TaxID=3252653 RepID=UPI003614365E
MADDTARVEGPDAELMDGLVQAAFAITSVLNRVGARHELSLTQLRVLGILRDRRLGVTELARHLGLDKSTISGLLDRAGKRGLVERGADPGDGRVVRVTLSEQGHHLAESIRVEVADLLAPFVDNLTRSEQGRMRALLARMGAGVL